MNWYSLRVMSGRENKVKDSIFRELDFEKDLKANVEEILIPTENIVDIKNGKKTVKEKSLLPGYILVKMTMNNETKFFMSADPERTSIALGSASRHPPPSKSQPLGARWRPVFTPRAVI